MMTAPCEQCDGVGFVHNHSKYLGECETCKGLGLTVEDANKMVFVNVYKVERIYGGAEEGGWWWNNYQTVEAYPTRNKNAESIMEFLKEEHKDLKYGDIYSVLGGQALVVLIEDMPGKSQTKEVPHYE